MGDKINCRSCSIPGVLVLDDRQVGIAEDREQLVLERGVDGSVLVVQPLLICVLAEDALLLRGRRPCWDLCCLTRVRREEKGGTREASILLGREVEVEVAVLASTKVALDRRCVCHKELLGLLDGGVVQLAGARRE